LVTEPPEFLSIMSNSLGVCDVILHASDSETHLSVGSSACHENVRGVNQTMMRLTPQAPLVGFHAMADDDGLTSLGLIFFDALTPECQVVVPVTNSSLDNTWYEFEDMGIFEASNIVYQKITNNERKRAEALATILK